MNKRSMSDSINIIRFRQCDDDDIYSNRPRKKTKTETVTKDGADSSTKTSLFHEQSIISDDIRERDYWVFTRLLGKGSYGSVHSAVRTKEGEEESLPQEMAIKKTELSQASRLKNEAEFLNRLDDSPYIVSYYGNVTTQDKKSKKMLYNTIFEYCQGQCLAKHIKRHKGIGLGEESVKIFAMSILIGLKHIHDEMMIHCDIKPKNILLAAESMGLRGRTGFVAKISGFGKAMEKGSIEYGDGCGHLRGTTRFMSPELIGDNVLDYGADVWAFGCTVLEMLSGERVWGEHGELLWEDWVTLIGDSDSVPYVPDFLSEDAKDFLSKCLEKDPVQRWTVGSLIKHPFLKWNNEYSDEEEEEEEEIFNKEEEIFEEEEEEEEEAIEIDEEYPRGDWEEIIFEEEEEEEEAQKEEEATEIDEEYPKEDWEEEDKDDN